VQQLAAEMYSASAVDSATVFCLLLAHDIKFSPRNWQFSLVDNIEISYKATQD